MNAIVSSEVPESARICCPAWFHKGGLSEMDMKVFQDRRLAIISNNLARLVIKPAESTPSCWEVKWEVCWSPQMKGWGWRHFSDQELAAAFGLIEDEGKSGYWMRHRYLLSSAEEGKYGRSGSYLNIPSPGTGHDGDPNISVYVTEEIRKAIAAILGFRE
ncbi:MAG TPA: hypothetical protein VMV71_03385 [Candidatus Paceibacterota bacterium]|nr:hypothetical protein [Candidatus Paceibacterota bacterium]